MEEAISRKEAAENAKAPYEAIWVVFDKDSFALQNFNRAFDLARAHPTIEAREASMRGLRDLTEGKTHQLIVWLPTRKPESDEDRQGDPFSVLRRIGAEFPGRRRTHKYSNRAAELPPIQASDDGSWTCPSPVGQDHDGF